MTVDPADTAAMQAAAANEGDYFGVRNGSRLMYSRVVGQRLHPSSAISDEQFPVNHLMAGDFVKAEKVRQGETKRLPVRQCANPDGSIDQDHQAGTIRLTPSGDPAAGGRTLTPSGYILRIGFRSEESAQTLISGMTHQALQSEADCIRVGGRPAGLPSLL